MLKMDYMLKAAVFRTLFNKALLSAGYVVRNEA
jgi:hypothetical protein